MRNTQDPIFKPSLYIAAGRGIALAVTFLIPVIFARVLTASQFGTYKQIFLIHATVYSIGLGLAESLFYFVPREPHKAGRYVANSVFLLGATGIAGWTILTIGREQIAHWFNNPEFSSIAPLIGAYVAVTMASAPLEVVMIARGQNRFAAATYALSDIVRAVFLLVPIIFSPRMDVLVAGSIAFGGLRMVGTFGFLGWEFRNELRPDLMCLRNLLLYAGPLQLAVVLQVLQVNLHQYMVSFRFDASTFAQYAVGSMHIPIFDLVGGSVLSVMMVRMSENLKQGKSELVLQMWSDTTLRLAAAFLPLIVLLAVVSSDLITLLFTDAYRSSVPLFRIWLLSYLFVTFQPHGVLRACGDTRFLALQNFIKLLLAVFLLFPMVSFFGPAGAVWSAVIAVFAGKCILLIRIKYLHRIRASKVLPWRSLAWIAAASLLAAVPAVALDLDIESRALRLFSVAASYTLVYAAIAWPAIWREDVQAPSCFSYRRWKLFRADDRANRVPVPSTELLVVHGKDPLESASTRRR
jgi:O-antigen/teichoic acid export membrane protein